MCHINVAMTLQEVGFTNFVNVNNATNENVSL